MSLTGWQGVAILWIAALLAIAGCVIPQGGAALITLATSMVTGVFALLQSRRDPTMRTRSGDRERYSTAAGGNPITPPPVTEPRR